MNNDEPQLMMISPMTNQVMHDQRRVESKRQSISLICRRTLASKTRAYVDHFSDVIVDLEPFAHQESGCQHADSPVNFRGDSFPNKLYQMLQDSPRNGTTHIISWDEYGRSFRIYDKEALEQFVLPRYVNESARSTNHALASHLDRVDCSLSPKVLQVEPL